MKRKHIKTASIIGGFFLLGLLGSCTSEEEIGKYPSERIWYTLEVTPNSLDYLSAKNASAQFQVTSNGKWTVTAQYDSYSTQNNWIKLGTTEGLKNGTVNVTFDDNTTLEDRSGEIVFKISSDNYSYSSIRVKQDGAKLTTFNDIECINPQRKSATINGTFTSFFPATEYGVVCSKNNSSPTIENYDAKGSVTLEGETNGEVTINVLVGELESGTRYYYRVYVKSKLEPGIEYYPSSGNTSFTTSGDIPGKDDNQRPGGYK